MHAIPKRLCQYCLLLTALSLSGCFMAPGSTIKTGAGQDRAWFDGGDGVWFPGFGAGQAAEDGQRPIEELVDIQPITPALLSSQLAARDVLGAAAPSAEFLQAYQDYNYLIGEGDVLHITVYDHPELTMPAGQRNNLEEAGITVRADGSIFYPYIGSVQVDGMPVEEVRDTITERLAEFIAEPQVDVRVVGFRSQRAFVTGQVAQPGPQPITNVPLTVLDAVSRAGGMAPTANWHDVLLVRQNGEEVRLSLSQMLNNGRLDQNLLLSHGDVLHVPDIGNQKVFVMGELNRINSLPMGNLPLSLTDALTQSGGINQVSANASGIFVIRQAPVDSELLATVYQLDARNALSLALGSRFMLQPADVVFVTTAPITRWNRVLSQIVPSLSSLILIENLGGN